MVTYRCPKCRYEFKIGIEISMGAPPEHTCPTCKIPLVMVEDKPYLGIIKKCSECVKEGKKSEIYPGVSHRTSMGSNRYYDEEGRYHNHNNNTTTTKYRCSNGHEWTERTTDFCWCGWPEQRSD